MQQCVHATVARARIYSQRGWHEPQIGHAVSKSPSSLSLGLYLHIVLFGPICPNHSPAATHIPAASQSTERRQSCWFAGVPYAGKGSRSVPAPLRGLGNTSIITVQGSSRGQEGPSSRCMGMVPRLRAQQKARPGKVGFFEVNAAPRNARPSHT